MSKNAQHPKTEKKYRMCPVCMGGKKKIMSKDGKIKRCSKCNGNETIPL